MKKNVAVIGYGGQGAWHCRQILDSEVVALSGIYDINPKNCEKAKNDDIPVYESVDAMLSDASVDIVVVVVPNDYHRELVVKALEAGKHVICEKPVATTVVEFDEMASAANRCGKLFSVHQNRRWDVDFLAMKGIVQSGEIGELMRIESRIHGSRGIPSAWGNTKAHGGGMMMDWGVHLIDQVMQIFDDDKVVKLHCTTTHYTTTEVEDGFKLTLYFESGKEAYIEMGTYNFIAMPRFYMQCKGGTAVITEWTKKTHVAKMKAWRETDVVPDFVPPLGVIKTMTPRDELTLEEYDIERPFGDMHDYYRNFCAAIEGNEELIVTLPQVRRVMQIMELSYVSAKDNRVLDVEI